MRREDLKNRMIYNIQSMLLAGRNVQQCHWQNYPDFLPIGMNNREAMLVHNYQFSVTKQ